MMTEVTTSIFTTIKKMLGISPDDTGFDTDILANINTVFMSLNQLGVGPSDVFSIEGETETWEDLLGDNLTAHAAVKTYIFLKVKLMFDAPSTSFVLNSMENQILELEYRLRTQVENAIVTDPPITI